VRSDIRSGLNYNSGAPWRKPLTRVLLTEKGRAAFVAYLDAIERLLPRAAE
jgi:hypothetical protein